MMGETARRGKTMGKRYLVGVDIGTQGVKAAVFALDGSMLGSGFEPSQLLHPGPGMTEEDPWTQYENMCKSVKSALDGGAADAVDVAAIAIGGQMAGVIGIDQDGLPVTPYDSWLDTRCAPYIRDMLRLGGQQVSALAGNAPSFNHGPKILWWKHENPRIYQRIARFVQPAGFAALRLTGGGADRAFIDQTYLHFSGFADNARSCWSQALLERFGIDGARMARIVAPTDIVGEICAEAATRCGLAEGTPVIAGCGDTAASFLAAGAVRPGICVDVSGTASVFGATTEGLVPDTIDGMLGVGRSAVPGLWHPYAYINGGGMNLDWIRAMLAGMRSGDVSFEELDGLADKAGEDVGAPLFVPHMTGRVSPGEPALRGAWLGLDRTHDVGHLYRAVLESIALEYRLYARRLARLNDNTPIQELRNTGGGKSSRLWQQIKADALGVEVLDVPDFAGATHGEAMIAGIGVALLGGLAETGRAWVRTGTVTRPRADKREFYQRRLALYESALAATRRFARDTAGE